MDFNEFFETSRALFLVNGLPEPSAAQAELLYRLTDIMLETNKVMNLTAITDVNAVILRHYVDSMLISKYIPQGSSVLDVGCGAGYPTLPLAIFRPDLRITALDSTAKRINYVAQTASELGLDNVTAIAARAEELAHDTKKREKFDAVTARAVAALPIISELCLPFVRVGGRFVAMKGSKGAEELAQAQNAITLCGGRTTDNIQAALTDVDGNSEMRCITVIEKVAATPQKFPRHYSKISKKPL